MIVILSVPPFFRASAKRVSACSSTARFVRKTRCISLSVNISVKPSLQSKKVSLASKLICSLCGSISISDEYIPRQTHERTFHARQFLLPPYHNNKDNRNCNKKENISACQKQLILQAIQTDNNICLTRTSTSLFNQCKSSSV